MRVPLLWVAILLFLLYTFTVNFVLDPGATEFFSHKDKLPKNIASWLTVMRVHTVFASVALIIGLLNFTLTRRHTLHRPLGVVYCLSVLVTVVTSGYMAPTATGGKMTSMAFNMLEMVWLAVTVTAVVFIYRKNPLRHRNWMIRSYMICFTNFSVHLLAFLLHAITDIDYRQAYVWGVYGSLLLLFLLAEYWIARKKTQTR